MPIPEVIEAFDEHIKNIPHRFIDLYAKPTITILDRNQVKEEHLGAIESITEADIEQHTSYANQRRGDVIRIILKSVVKYAVLSHTWREAKDEFTYDQMISPTSVRDGLGWSKLMQFVKLARSKFNCRYAWADTVCVNPQVSGDRQAAARCGFDWFRNAYVCIVYLASTRSMDELEGDKWFRRGWPLPELLAPIRIKFYGAGWEPLNVGSPNAENDKADGKFLDVLSKAAGIPKDDLRSFLPGPNRVREKLVWASRRETTTPEDKAYSLISIFVSRMAINPGEGENAFPRLMVSIIPKSRECDVFAWAGKRAEAHPAIPSSPAGYGPLCRDRELNCKRHHYRLCGDRSFSLDHDHLTMKVIFIHVALTKAKALEVGYDVTVTSRSHRATIDKVELLTKPLPDVEMAIAVIDYGWTGEPGRGKLCEGECYFGFLLQRSSKDARWEKIDTEKVVFIDVQETKEHELQVLHLLC